MMDKSQNQPQSPSAPWSGDDERPSQDNGTQGKTSYQMGDPSGNSFPASGMPADYRLTPGEAAEDSAMEVDDYGLNEAADVGNNQSIANYGIDGPPAGGGLKRNTVGTTS